MDFKIGKREISYLDIMNFERAEVVPNGLNANQFISWYNQNVSEIEARMLHIDIMIKHMRNFNILSSNETHNTNGEKNVART